MGEWGGEKGEEKPFCNNLKEVTKVNLGGIEK